VTVLSSIVFVLSALASVAIWILGTGVPWNQHFAMGLFFFLVNATSLWLIVNPRPGREWVGFLAASFTVPIEILAIFAVGLAMEALK
jgi:hypothetical protein